MANVYMALATILAIMANILITLTDTFARTPLGGEFQKTFGSLAGTNFQKTAFTILTDAGVFWVFYLLFLLFVFFVHISYYATLGATKKESEVSDLKKEIEMLKKKNKGLEAELRNEKKRNEDCKKEKNDLKKTIDHQKKIVFPWLQKKIEAARSALKEKSEELVEAMVKLGKVGLDLKKKKEAMEEAKEELKTVKKALGEAEGDLKGVKKELSGTKNKLVEAMKVVETINDAKLSQKLTDWEGDLKEMRARLSDMNRRGKSLGQARKSR